MRMLMDMVTPAPYPAAFDGMTVNVIRDITEVGVPVMAHVVLMASPLGSAGMTVQPVIRPPPVQEKGLVAGNTAAFT